MSIDDLLRNLSNPKATIAYPQRVIHRSDTGHDVLGLDPAVQTLVMQGQTLVEPLQVVRRPGLGDKVFALAATYAYLQEHPEADVTFSGLDTDSWLSLIPWVKTGVNPACNTVVNLDNTPCNGGDRTRLMGGILGVDVTSIEFPIIIPKKKLGLKKPYYVFVPFAARCGPRSLPLETTLSILRKSPVRLAVTDGMKYAWDGLDSKVANCTGMDMFELVALLSECAGVIGIDTGVPWLGAALGRPVLVMGGHVAGHERTQCCRNVLWVTPQLCRVCGDHVGTRPDCRWQDAVPKCMSHLTPEFVRFQMREFEKIV